MSTQALKASVTGQSVSKASDNTIAGLMTNPKIKAQMALALPKHMTADRLARIALTEIRKTPALARCDQTSFLGAIMQCAQLGLEPVFGPAENPFPWMSETMDLKKEKNFFETRVTEYQAGGALTFDDDHAHPDQPGWNNPLEGLQ